MITLYFCYNCYLVNHHLSVLPQPANQPLSRRALVTWVEGVDPGGLRDLGDGHAVAAHQVRVGHSGEGDGEPPSQLAFLLHIGAVHPPYNLLQHCTAPPSTLSVPSSLPCSSNCCFTLPICSEVTISHILLALLVWCHQSSDAVLLLCNLYSLPTTWKESSGRSPRLSSSPQCPPSHVRQSC